MRPTRTGAVVAVMAAAVAAGCGSSTAQPSSRPASTSSSTSPRAAPTVSAATAVDVSFAQQAAMLIDAETAMAALAAQHATDHQVRQLAAHMAAHRHDATLLRQQLHDRHAEVPPAWSPTASPPASMGAGRHDGDWADWQHHYAEMQDQHGAAFDGHATGQLSALQRQLVTLCATELRFGHDPQLRQLAQRMLTEHQAELSELQHD